MKNVIVTILLAVFLMTSIADISVYGQGISVIYEDDKKRDNKKKDPPGPVVVKEKKKEAPSDKERPKKGKKPDQ